MKSRLRLKPMPKIPGVNHLEAIKGLQKAGFIIVLNAKRSTYPMLKPLMPQVLETLENIKPGEIVIVG